ncbi:MAG: DUF3857 domain-containing protein [Bacteroidetes bacterium]|nr:DUF3857 domain-containing protein [Bacteroidota bacterium]
MKKLLFFFLTSVLCLQTSNIFSQDENYDAVYLRLTKEYTLNPDGSIDYRYIKQQKLQTYRSFHSLYGETFIVYNPDFQSLKINEASTIMADGKKNPSPENAFNEVLPAFAANAPAFNKLREMVITHSGTERNAVINLDYQLHSNKGFYPCLMGNELLAEVEPVKELTLVLKIPPGMTVYFSMLNSIVKPVITADQKQQVYTWKFTNVPAISTEEFQRGTNDLYPRLIFSTSGDRSSLYADLLKQPAFSYELSNEMKEMVAAVCKEYKEKTDAVLKLQDKVVNEFRLYPVPLRYVGFKCRTPQETWNSNGGTLLEKAVLLAAILREAGVEANPVFSIRQRLFDESVGSLLDVEDIIVKANLPEEGGLYLSVNSLNSQDLRYTSPDRVFVELNKPAVSMGKTPPCTSQIKFEGSFSVNDKNQLSGSVTCTESDAANPYLMLLRDKNKTKSLFGGGLSSADLKDPVTINSGKDESSMSFAVQKDKPFRIDSDYFFFTLPFMTNGIENLGIHLLPKNRTTPFEISSPIEESNDFSIVLPAGLKAFIPKEKFEAKNKTGAFSYEVKQEKGKVVIHKSLKLNSRLIQPEDYAGFKTLMDHWNAERYREIVFVKGN